MSGPGAGGGPRVPTLHLEAENRLEEIGRVIDAFEVFSAVHELADPVRRSVKLVLDDLLNNVISYGYDDAEPHVIDVRVELPPDRLVLRITDDGRPFNPLERHRPDVDLGLDDREIGGLGLHLVESMMDEVSYARHDDRNVTVLAKRLPDPDTGKEPS